MAPDYVISYEHAKCIGRGEGEVTIVEFCEAVRNGMDPIDIAGTWAKDEAGNIIKNPNRPLVNINDVLPYFSFFDDRRFLRPLEDKIWKTIPIETYRGCPYTCAFCNSPAQVVIAKQNEQGNFLRRKGMDTLRREINAMCENLDADFFYINDDAFLSRPKAEAKAFADMYGDFGLPFWFQTRFEDVDAEKLEWMSDAGCHRISFGLEHGNEKYRREKLFRNISNSKILDLATIVTESGIPYTLNNIVGFPYETRDLLFESVALNREIKTFDSLSVNIFVPYRGTALRELAIKEGWLSPEAQTTSVIGESVLKMPPPYLSAKEIYSLQRVFSLYVRFSESRYPEIKRAESGGDEGDVLFKALSEEFYRMVYGKDEADRKLTYQGQCVTPVARNLPRQSVTHTRPKQAHSEMTMGRFAAVKLEA